MFIQLLTGFKTHLTHITMLWGREDEETTPLQNNYNWIETLKILKNQER